MEYNVINLPPQQLAFSKKNKVWRKQHLDWADSKTFFNYSLVRNSVLHKKINYDLINGIIHMQDLELILNPSGIKNDFIPDNIQHYPIMNSKLNVLRGEESKRVFDYRVVVTNPNAITEIENNKKKALFNSIQQWIEETHEDENSAAQELEKLSNYYTYEWQDFLEVQANELLKHYSKEYNFPLLFNNGFMDAMTVGEEIYLCDIVSGEPIIEKLNPLKVRVFKSGYSNKIEDADVIIIEDYWSPGKIIDTYYDQLSKKDIDYIESSPTNLGTDNTDSMGNIDARGGLINANMLGEEFAGEGFYFDPMNLFSNNIGNSLLPFDVFGNIRVLKMFWKSRRRIKKVKSYNPETGEVEYNFYPETYIIDKDAGEEEQIFYINEAWEGVKIGKEIYVNMRPRVIQYNRLSNPSRCHFGIVGTIYNLNESKPFSIVDMMKPYNYTYDVIHDRLNKLIANNWGKIVTLDLAKVPKGWDVEKWMYFAKNNNLAVIDSFKEGNVGAATGKLAGALNNASSGVIDAELGNSIQLYINLLEFIKMEMSEVVGITKQREGQISNRETVGGVERATLQSSYITEWLFFTHEDTKKRAIEAFIETAKIAMKGRNKKFTYTSSDTSLKVMEIDGEEYANADYGLVVDSNNSAQELNQKLDMLAQAALQNQKLDFSTIMKLYSSSSLAEKQRMVEINEKKMMEQQQQQYQQELQSKQQTAQMEMQQKQLELQQKEQANIRDNETKILVATLNSSVNDGIQEVEYSEEAKENLKEKIRQFNEKLKLDKERLAFDKEKAKKDAELKEKQINKYNKKN